MAEGLWVCCRCLSQVRRDMPNSVIVVHRQPRPGVAIHIAAGDSGVRVPDGNGEPFVELPVEEEVAED